MILFLYMLITFNLQDPNEIKLQLKSELERAHYEAQEPAWMNIKSKIERTQTMIKDDHHLEYYMAFIYDHLANFYMESDDDKADDYLDLSIEHLDRSLELKETEDANALYSSVLGKKIGIAPLKGMFLGPKSNSMIERAMEMNENNPRVLITDAIGKMFKPSMFGGDKEASRKLLTKAISLSDTYQDPDPYMVSWGKADAYAWLANLDMLENRNDEAKKNLDAALEIEQNYGYVKYVLMKKIN